MYHNLFIPSPVDEHLACFQVGVITMITAVNIHIQVFGWIYASFLLGKFLGVEWLGNMVCVCLTFLRSCQVVLLFFCSNILAHLKLLYFLIIKFWVFFRYSGYKFFIGYVIFKYFPPVFFKEQMFLILTKSDLVIFCLFMKHAFNVIFKKS